MEIFTFNIQSISDIITNSSSELFVFNDKGSVDEVINLLNQIYPSWRDEYSEPKQLNLLSDDDLETYLGWMYRGYDYRNGITKETSNQCGEVKEFELDPKLIYSNWDKFNPSAKYKDFDGDWNSYAQVAYIQLSQEGLNIIRNIIPDTTVILYSLSDNPNFDYQEILEQYAIRKHLG